MNTCRVVVRPENLKIAGTMPVYLRITINRKKRDYPLNIEILPEHWDNTKRVIKRSAPQFNTKNLIITKALNKAETILLNFQLKNIKNVTHSLFEKDYFELNQNQNSDFYPIANSIIESYKGKYSSESIRHYKAELSKLKHFKSSVTFSDLDYEFFTKYEYYMRNDLKNHSNTIHKTFYYLRNILNSAAKLKYIDENPLLNYKIKKEPGEERVYLNIEEVKLLENLLQNDLNPKLKNTLIAFLFSCYTSLRYCDIKQLTIENLDFENNCIKIKQQKTKEIAKVPLSKQAKRIIDLIGKTKDKLFIIYSNQKVNEYLKILALMANIDKNISFHVARHTFATISLNLGIRIEVVSELLGHNSIRTTAIYAKLLDKTKHEEMKKWEKI